MINTRPLTAVLFCATASIAFAQWQTVGNVTSITNVPNGVEVQAGRAVVRVTALSASVVRVRYTRERTFPPEHSFAVLPQPGFAAPEVHVRDGAGAVELATSNLTVRVDKPSAGITFLDATGNVIVQDDPQRPVTWNGATFRVYKKMPDDEHYFGLGEKAGRLDHRGQAFTNWNTDAYGYQEGTDPLYQTVPFFIGFRQARAYGLFLDNTYRSSFDFGRGLRNSYSFGAEGGELDYYFFYGPEPRKVIEAFTQLTGRAPLPPLFALGFQQSRYSYFPEARVLEIAGEFRRRKIPADVIYLDIDYQDRNRPFTVDSQRFPHFRQMIHDLANEGFKTVLITDLHLAKASGYKPYDEGIAHDYFVHNPDGSVFVGKVWPGDSVFPDFTRSDVRQWWGQLYTDFVNDGVRGFWNDMNEPAVFQRADATMPLDTVHRVEDRVTDHREIHNVFGMENACATYDGLLKLRPDERPLVLTRAGYAGAWRCAATWTGDNSSTWNHLKISVPMLLNLGISGYVFAGADIGGYAGSPSPELLTRWLELGAFNPFYRDHTEKGSADQEPWVHGPEQERIRRRFIELRYQLLPYIYSGMEEASRTGMPLMRPMFLEFPQDASLTSNDTEFMFGSAFLVAPKMTDGFDPVVVHLPAGRWYDFWTGDVVDGGKELRVTPVLDTLPIYVRAGAIIPEQPVVQYVGAPMNGPITLDVYPGPDCHGELYADDGNTLAYKKGEYQRSEFSCSETNNGVRISLGAPSGTFTPSWHEYDIRVHGAKASPKATSADGKPVSGHFDGGKHEFTVAVPAGKASEIVIQY